MEFAESVAGHSVRDAVALLLSDEVVEAFAAEIPVELVSSTATQQGDDTWRHVMKCRFATRGLNVPGVVRAVLPDEIRLTWDETWTVDSDTHATAEVSVTTEGSPSAEVHGRSTLVADDGRMDYRYEGTTKVSVPFVGGQLADLVDEHLVAGILHDRLTVLARSMSD